MEDALRNQLARCIIITDCRVRYYFAGKRHAYTLPGRNDNLTSQFAKRDCSPVSHTIHTQSDSAGRR